MQEYKPNSQLSKERQAEAAREKKFEKVVSGNVKTRENKKRKFFGNFIAEDSGSVMDIVVNDVILPAVKKLISEGVATTIDTLLYGESRSDKRRSSDKVSYRKYYDERYGDRRESESRRTRSGGRFDYDDILFDTRGEAEVVLKHMRDAIKEYQLVSVGDMYDMSDESCPFTYYDYGWTSLRTAEVKRVRDGYIIDLPRAMDIR